MKLTMYKYAATPDRVDKTDYLTEIGKIQDVSIKDDTVLMNPVFILRKNSVVYNANYVFCSFTQRYYYINDIVAMTAERIAIQCSIDVLHTYRKEILDSSAWVTRSERSSNKTDFYMLHNDYPFRQDYDTLGRDFVNGENVFPGSSGGVEPSVTNNILFIIK